MLFRNDDHAKTFSANRYTDHRKENEGAEEQSRDARILKNVSSAIEELDPDDEKHRCTYRAIMARNRVREEQFANVHRQDDEDGNDGGNAPPNARAQFYPPNSNIDAGNLLDGQRNDNEANTNYRALPGNQTHPMQ